MRIIIMTAEAITCAAGAGNKAALKRDEIWMNRHRAAGLCLCTIFSENRFTLVRIMR
jgi:hypothetical protein